MLLAAGLSTRFKGDKRLAGQPPLILRTLTTLVEVFDAVYVIIRADDTIIQTYLEPYPVRLVYAPSTPKGLSVSIASGMKAIPNEVCSVSICLADMPLIQASTYRSLLQSQRDDLIIRPQYLNQSGHPVVFGRTFFQALRTLDSQQFPAVGAKSILQSASAQLRFIHVDDMHVLTDIDVQADLDVLS